MRRRLLTYNAGVGVTLYDHRTSICSQMARLVLDEKGVVYERRQIDIRGAAGEQFEPWYVALNPNVVVPTLQHDERVVTDTLRISEYVDASFEGPPLVPDDAEAAASNRRWMEAAMAPHYGVLLYGPMVDDEGRCATVQSRHELLTRLLGERPEHAEVLQSRIAGNERFQELLADPGGRQRCVEQCRELVRSLEAPLAEHAFLVDDAYRIADAFATAALARFESHGHAEWWSELPAVRDYYARMQARESWTRAEVLNGDLGYDG